MSALHATSRGRGDVRNVKFPTTICGFPAWCWATMVIDRSGPTPIKRENQVVIERAMIPTPRGRSITAAEVLGMRRQVSMAIRRARGADALG